MRPDKRVVKYKIQNVPSPDYTLDEIDELIADNWQPWGQPWYSEKNRCSLQVWVQYEPDPVEMFTQNNY